MDNSKALSEKELEKIISSVSMDYYRSALDAKKHEILTWVPKLMEMSDHDFVLECSSKILDSAIMNRFRGNADGIHAMAGICHDEAQRRHVAAGHISDCRGSSLYQEGYNLARRSQGYPAEKPFPCTCGESSQAAV